MSYMFGYCCRSEPVRNEYKVFRAFQISLWLWKSLFKHFTDFTDFAISFQSPRFDILNLWGSYEEMVYMWEKQCYYNMRWKMRKCCGKWRSNQVNMLWICYFETLYSYSNDINSQSFYTFKTRTSTSLEILSYDTQILLLVTRFL